MQKVILGNIILALTIGVPLAMGCRPASSPSSSAAPEGAQEPESEFESEAEAESEADRPAEVVLPELPPMDIGLLTDDAESPCAASVDREALAVEAALGRTWVLGYRGRLSSFDKSFQREQAHLSGRSVVAIHHADDGSLWAIIDEANRWRIVRRSSAGWHHLGDAPGASLVAAFDEREGRPVMASIEGAIMWLDASGRTHLWKLGMPSKRTKVGALSIVHAGDGALYIANNAGEFGGGLERLRPSTSAHPTTQKRIFNEPVVDVMVDPVDHRCALIVRGMFGVGRQGGDVLRSCAGDTGTVSEEELIPKNSDLETRIFYQLVAAGPAIYAFADTDIYAITHRRFRRLPTPAFTDHCGLSVAHVEGLTLIHDAEARHARPLPRRGRFAIPDM